MRRLHRPVRAGVRYRISSGSNGARSSRDTCSLYTRECISRARTQKIRPRANFLSRAIVSYIGLNRIVRNSCSSGDLCTSTGFSELRICEHANLIITVCRDAERGDNAQAVAKVSGENYMRRNTEKFQQMALYCSAKYSLLIFIHFFRTFKPILETHFPFGTRYSRDM